MAGNNTSVINYLSSYFEYSGLWILFGKVALVLLITLCISLISHYILKSIHDRFLGTKSIWDDAIAGSAKKPIQLLIWVVGISFCVDILNSAYNFHFYQYAITAKGLIIIGSVVWFVLGMISKLEKYWYKLAHKDESKIDKASIDAIANLLRVITIIFAALSGAEVIGVGISGIIALAGGSSLGVAFASKDLVANFFGALMIYLDKPFKVGEWIRMSKDTHIEGYVEKIGLRCTIIKTLDKRPLYVPNSLFAVQAIENPSRMTHRKFCETIGIRHEDISIAGKLTNMIDAYLKAHTGLDHKLPCFASVDTITESGVNILICAYTKVTEVSAFHSLKQELLLKIAIYIEQLESKIAQNNSVIHVSEKLFQSEEGKTNEQS